MNKLKLDLCLAALLILITGQVYAQNYGIKSFIQGNLISRTDNNPLFRISSFPNYISSSFNNNTIYKPLTQDLRMDSVIVCSISGDSAKMSFEYNQKDDLTGFLIQFRSAGRWDNNLTEKLLYDVNNNLIREIDLSWNGITWDTTNCINNYYDAKGNLVQSIVQFFTDSLWTNSVRYTFTHDSSTIIIDTMKIDRWQNNEWNKNLFTVAYYSGVNKRDSILSFNWDGAEWLKGNRIISYYDKNISAPDSIISTFWAGDWINLIRENYTYDNDNNEIEEVEQNWLGYIWQNIEQRTFTYNDYNLLKSISCEIWDNNEWTSGDGQIQIIYQNNVLLGFYANRADFYYTDITSITNNGTGNVMGFTLFQNYPNPFNPSTTINYTIPEQGFVSIKVYNMLGQEISTLVNEVKLPGSYQIHFNADNLPSGVYIYRIKTGTFTKSMRMILLK